MATGLTEGTNHEEVTCLQWTKLFFCLVNVLKLPMCIITVTPLTLSVLPPLYHHMHFIFLPHGSAVAPRDFPLQIHIPPTVDLFIYPWVAFNILFICSSKVCWNGNKLALLCSLCCSIKNNATMQGLLAFIGSRYSPEHHWMHIASSIRYPQCLANLICNFPFLQPWHILWQLARGRGSVAIDAMLHAFIATHPPTQTTKQCMLGTRLKQYALQSQSNLCQSKILSYLHSPYSLINKGEVKLYS